MSEKTIYGQAWISNGKVVQDVTIFSETGCKDQLNVLVEDIWEDLTSESGTYKSNDKKNYFYWEYDQTSIDNDDVTVKARLGCPEPKAGLFKEPLDLDNASGDYAKYWMQKMIVSRENANRELCIQRKEIYLHGCSYFDYTGAEHVIPDMYINNEDCGDITNLLNLF